MRYDRAVSEVLGAVFLIGIVVVAFAVIGTYLMGSSPDQGVKFPTATTGSYCVECESSYEVIVKHDAGESFPTDSTEFKVLKRNGQTVSPDAVEVYTKEPPECSAKSSLSPSGGIKYNWESISSFGPGMIAKVIVNKGINETEGDIPKGIIILNNGQTGPGGTGTQYFDRVKDETSYNDTTSSVQEASMKELMTGKFTPVLENNSVSSGDYGFCNATFYYDNTLDMTLKVSPCTGEASIIDENGNPIRNTSCPQPWNEFVGIGTGDFNYLKKDMGQPKEFLANSESSKASRSFTVPFKNWIQWRLGNSVSAIAKCDSVKCSCGASETCIWGYMYYDTNNNGLKDAGEPGFTEGKVNLTGRYKNNPNVENFVDLYTPLQTGGWNSRCIQMSGWAFDLIADLPSGYYTNNSYLNYDNKLTGQDKKNPPQVDFGVVAKAVEVTPTPTPTPTVSPTVIPINEGGVGAQLYAADDTTDVSVDFAFSDAGYENVFRLDSPRTVALGNSKTTKVGTSWTLGKFATNQELIFADVANGRTYKTGPASRNPDGIVHGAISLKNSTGTYHKYLITFEDFYGGGDKDYNDVEFYVNGNVSLNVVPTPTPTPAPTVTPAPDTTPPSVSGITRSQQNKTKPVIIGWTASDNFGVTKIEIRLSDDGGSTYPYILRSSSWTTTAGQTKTDSYSWTPGRSYSNAKFKVIAYDAAGNSMYAVSSSFNVQH